MEDHILDKFNVPPGVLKRISNKWFYVIRSCWNNLFDYEIKSITYGQLYVDNDGLELYINLPPVEDQNSFFKDNRFSVQLLFTEIEYITYNASFLEKKKLRKLYSFNMRISFDNDIYTIYIIKNKELISFHAKKIYLQYMYIEKNNIYGFFS